MSNWQYTYTMKALGKTLQSGRVLFKDTYLSFIPGAKIGVIGANGAGKSTLLKIMAGVEKEFSGEAFAAKGARIGYLAQEPKLNPDKDVHGNIMEGLGEVNDWLAEFNDISMKLGEVTDNDEMMELLEKQGDLQEKIDAADGWEVDRTVEIAMDALRCPDGASDVTKLSGGEIRRVALTKLLLQKPDLLLLDEPTNHLDAESVAWLQRTLKDYTGTVVTITHDRYFLDEVAGWILEIDRGNLIPHEGNYSSWLDARAKRLEQEQREADNRKKSISSELEWVRQNPKGRQSKSKARLNSFDELVAQQDALSIHTADIVIPAAERLGQQVLDTKDLRKGYGNRLLIEDLTFSVPAGAIIGVIGANGAGKSTLFKMITDVEQPDGGTLKLGDTVNLGYVDQSRDALNDNRAVWEEISDGQEEIMLGKKTVKARAYASSFNFKGGDQQKKVGDLSGGERNRVHLAKMLKQGANFLLLDEPTNDLDVETLRALEDALLAFAGCVMVISHDRWFLDRIATHILAFEGDSHVEWFPGNYQAYEEDRFKRLGDYALQPKRLKYKPLVR